jgi:hypothetical protein
MPSHESGSFILVNWGANVINAAIAGGKRPVRLTLGREIRPGAAI